MLPRTLDAVSHCCPDDLTELELLENSNPIFNRRVYGCQKCDSVFDFRATIGCTSPGGYTKRKETLTDYKKKIADEPQVKIRLERLMLAQELGQLREKVQDAQREYQKGEIEFQEKIKALRAKCEHPNMKPPSEFCDDCGHRKSEQVAHEYSKT